MSQVILVKWEFQVHKDYRDHLDHLDKEEKGENLGLQVQMALLAWVEERETKAHQEILVQWVFLALLDLRFHSH